MVTLAVLLTALPGPQTASAADDILTDSGVTLEAIQVPTPDGDVHGRLGYIANTTPTRLVFFAHGYGWTIDAGWLHHMERTVRDDTAVVATDYRDNLGFPVLRGAEDLIQATLLAKDRFPTIETVYLFGVSMGGAISGTAIVEAPRSNGGQGLFDVWLDVEGVTMLHETYYEARAVGHAAAKGIERDTGGAFEEVPEEYLRRSPALRAGEMADLGLEHAFVVHALNDGLVPYDQGREMSTALLAAGVPTKFATVTRDDPDQTSGTTGTNALFGAALGGDPNDTLGLDLAGHASEADEDHPVMRTAFDALEAMLDGTYTPFTYTEAVVDDKL